MKKNIFEYIILLILSILIGDFAQTNFIRAVIIFIVGFIISIYLLNFYERVGLFPINKDINKVLWITGVEIIGFLLGYFNIISINEDIFYIGTIIFLVILILVVFFKEISYLFKNINNRKMKK